MQKIYIAGPDVFEKDSIVIGKRLVDLCAEYGYKGLYPLDNVVDFSQDKHTIAEDIFQANIKMIQEADIVIANLNQFRGKEPDSGTVWECGYAYGLGKKVYGYMESTQNYIDTFRDDERVADGEDFVDLQGRLIEDFSHPVNLMLASSMQLIEGNFESVLQTIGHA